MPCKRHVGKRTHCVLCRLKVRGRGGGEGGSGFGRGGVGGMMLYKRRVREEAESDHVESGTAMHARVPAEDGGRKAD